uniref:F-box only protein 6-like n=2 Tax=Kryptolebias marmoratus TaxID=37003 RepID=A0A3Q3A239_KRYMA
MFDAFALERRRWYGKWDWWVPPTTPPAKHVCGPASPTPESAAAALRDVDVAEASVSQRRRTANRKWTWKVPSAIRPSKRVRSRSKPTPESATAVLQNVDILEEIFLNLPPHEVVHQCRLVCVLWKEAADRNSLWKERCRREGYRLCEAYKTPEDWRLFYFLSKNRRNFIRNPRGEERLNHWKILQNGGDGWRVTDVPAPHPDKRVRKTFVTSFYIGQKLQMIDLKEEGYNPFFMDHFQPDIRISDWIITRWDCGSQYHIHVDLLNENMESIQVFSPPAVYLGAGGHQHWNQMTHIFQNYGPGVRYIRFIHGGKDTRFWKGFFGVHITQTCVEICPAMHKPVGTGLGRTDKDEMRKATSRACTIS